MMLQMGTPNKQKQQNEKKGNGYQKMFDIKIKMLKKFTEYRSKNVKLRQNTCTDQCLNPMASHRRHFFFGQDN